MTTQNNGTLVLCYVKLCASFQSHLWILPGVSLRKRPFWVKIDFFVPCDLEIRQMALKNNRAAFYATLSFVHCFIAIGEFKLELQSGNAQIGTKFGLTSVTLICDLRPWSFAWILLLSLVITPEKIMMIQWEEHCEKGVTVRRTDWRKEVSQLKSNYTTNYVVTNTIHWTSYPP